MRNPSEKKFREYLKKLFLEPDTYIKKVADKKQGAIGNQGLPDYLVISQSKTLWFEVKKSVTKTTFNLNSITTNQYSEFTKMMNAGAKIFVAIYVQKELFLVDFREIQLAKIIEEKRSVHINELNALRVTPWK